MEKKPTYHKGELKKNIQREIRLAEKVVEIRKIKGEEMKPITKIAYSLGFVAFISTVIHDYTLWRNYSQLTINLFIAGCLIAFGWTYERIKDLQKDLDKRTIYVNDTFTAYGEKINDLQDSLNKLNRRQNK